ncbi:acylneuraminate cytidylyltransferase family protein [Flavihumibacter sp. R14]|nr:acylneuraminate cytidylyltransferase family protein [Flavihumibacter soli]
MSILITICARGGSKGIPGKNIMVLNGKPLIYYSLNTASNYAAENEDVDLVLSTDSIEIKNIVREFGFNIDIDYSRPDYLSGDSAGKIDAINDVRKYSESKNNRSYKYIIDLDVTSPLRTIEDIQKAFTLLENDPEAYNIFSVSPANRNPYFNMVEQNESGYFSTCKTGTFFTRQSAPRVYDMNASFYIYRSNFFDDRNKKAITDKSLIYVVPHVCFDLDHPIDFTIMSFLMENNLLDSAI